MKSIFKVIGILTLAAVVAIALVSRVLVMMAAEANRQKLTIPLAIQ